MVAIVLSFFGAFLITLILFWLLKKTNRAFVKAEEIRHSSSDMSIVISAISILPLLAVAAGIVYSLLSKEIQSDIQNSGYEKIGFIILFIGSVAISLNYMYSRAKDL